MGLMMQNSSQTEYKFMPLEVIITSNTIPIFGVSPVLQFQLLEKIEDYILETSYSYG